VCLFFYLLLIAATFVVIIFEFGRFVVLTYRSLRDSKRGVVREVVHYCYIHKVNLNVSRKTAKRRRIKSRRSTRIARCDYTIPMIVILGAFFIQILFSVVAFVGLAVLMLVFALATVVILISIYRYKTFVKSLVPHNLKTKQVKKPTFRRIRKVTRYSKSRTVGCGRIRGNRRSNTPKGGAVSFLHSASWEGILFVTILAKKC
jgi:membrane protein YdbS with pleckstrin-like domain